MDSKVDCVVTKVAPPKCEGDSGESQSQVSLVIGHDGISYDQEKQQQQPERDSIHGPKILPPIGDQDRRKNVTVKKGSDQKSFNIQIEEIGGIFCHDVACHIISGHVISEHIIFGQVLISTKNQTLLFSSPNDHKGNCSHVVQERARIGDDPVTGKTVDAATGKPVIFDPVTGLVVNEATEAPVASLDSSVSPASLASESPAQMATGPQIVKGSSDDDINDDVETSIAKESAVEKQFDEEAKKIEAHAKAIQSSAISGRAASSRLVSKPIE